MIIKQAKENAISVITSYFKPWVENLEGNYELVVK